jgi:hypothetical protein
MPEHDEPTIERNSHLDLDVDDLWTLISTSDGWKSWLVDDADITVAPDATGTATNDGVERSVHIESVDVGRGITFSWWDHDDPSTASYVQLDIVELPGRTSHLHIAERLIGATPAMSMSCSITLRWEVALVSLWLLALPSLVTA